MRFRARVEQKRSPFASERRRSVPGGVQRHFFLCLS
jgi:hypothetical protein